MSEKDFEINLDFLEDLDVSKEPEALEENEEVVVEQPEVEPVVEPVVELVEKPAKKEKAKKATEDSDASTNMVAIYSSRSVSWDGVGKVERGYNIVTKEQADKWLKRIHVRIATPEEIRGASIK